MKYWPIIGLILIGCEGKHPTLPLGNSLTSTPVTATPQSQSYVFMGQSNSVGLANHAYPFRRAFGGGVGIHNCAVNGSAIKLWQKGDHLYDACMADIKHVPVTTIIFWQGEYEAEGGDNVDQYDADNWPVLFTQMCRSLQADIPGVKIFYVRLGDIKEGSPYWTYMRHQQESISLPKVFMVSSDGIPALPNDRHYSAEGYEAINCRVVDQIKAQTDLN